MPRLQIIIYAAGLFILGGLLGLLAGRKTAPQTSQTIIQTTSSSLPVRQPTLADETSDPLHRSFAASTEKGSAAFLATSLQHSLTEPSSRRNYLIYNLVQNLTLEDIPTILAQIEKDRGLQKNDTFLAAFLQRWAELDAKSALSYAQKHTAPGGLFAGKQSILVNVLTGWAIQDITSALNWVKQNLQGPQKTAGITGILSAVTPQNAETVLALIENEILLGGSEIFSNLFKLLAMQNPDAAAGRALKISDKRHREAALKAVALQWGSSDPVKAMAWANSIADKSLRSSLREQILKSWASDNSEAALAAIQQISDPAEKEAALANLISAIAKTGDIRQAITLFEQLPPGGRRVEAGNALFTQWISTDPDAALEYLAKMEENRDKQRLLSTAVQQLVQLDPQKAVALAGKLDDRSRRSALAALGSAWAALDPKAAAEYSASLNDEERTRFLYPALTVWIDKDPDAALQWANSLTDSRLQASVRQTLVNMLAYNEPQKAASIINQLQGEDLNRAISTLASNWTRNDPLAAGQWASSLSPELQSRAYREIMQSWTYRDPVAASEWLISLPANSTRDEAIRVLADRVSRSDPESAWRWITVITDSNMRQREAYDIGRDWMRANPEQAKPWIEKTDFLSPEQKQQLLKIESREQNNREQNNNNEQRRGNRRRQ